MEAFTATLPSHLGCASRSNSSQRAADGNEASFRTLSNVFSQVALLTTSDASQFANALLAPVEGSRIEAGSLTPLMLVQEHGAQLGEAVGRVVERALRMTARSSMVRASRSTSSTIALF